MHDGSFPCHQSSSPEQINADQRNNIEIVKNILGLEHFSSLESLIFFSEMSVDARTPLLTDRERIHSFGERELHNHERRREDSTDSQLTALADQLGFQADAFSGTSTERENNNPSKRGRHGPINDSVVTISHEQLEELLTALETTSDLIKQVGMNSVELDNLTRRRR